MTKRAESMAKVLVRRVGLIKTARVMSFVMMYGGLMVDGGSRPSMEDYAEAWACSVSRAYRDLRLFREALPEFGHPADLVEYALAHRSDPAFGALPVMWGVA